MPSAGQDIASVIKKQIEEFGGELSMVDVGTVIEAADGVARIHGLSGVKYSEVLSFPGGVLGMALNLEENSVGAVILGDYLGIKEGDEVKSTGKIIQVPVGNDMLGRVLDPLGRPLDGKGDFSRSITNDQEKKMDGLIK